MGLIHAVSILFSALYLGAAKMFFHADQSLEIDKKINSLFSLLMYFPKSFQRSAFS